GRVDEVAENEGVGCSGKKRRIGERSGGDEEEALVGWQVNLARREQQQEEAATPSAYWWSISFRKDECWRLLPPRLAGGINGSTCAHSSSVRSLGYRNLLRS